MNALPPGHTPNQRALLIALAYATLAALWILLSDSALAELVSDPYQLTQAQTYKGWFFVGTTAVMLFFMARWQIAAAETAHLEARANAEQLRSILASMNDLVFVFDQQYRYIACYQPEADTLMVPPDQFMHRRVDEIGLPPETAQRFINAIDALKSSEQMITVDYLLDVPLGQRWFSAHFSRLRDSTGAFSGVTCVVRDISDHRRAEAALRASELQFRTLLENIPNISVQGYNEQREVIFWNPASEKLYGYSSEEAQGRLLETLIIPGPMRDAVVEQHTRWIQHDEPIPPGELDLLHKDGRNVPVFSSHALMRNSRNEAEMYCIDIDIGDMRKAQSELRLAETVFEGSGEGILVTDTRNRILSANAAFSQITGYPRDEIIGHDPSFLSSGRHDATFFHALWQSLQETDHWQGEVWNRRKNGDIFPQWQGISAVRNEPGQITHYVAIFSDISEKKATEAKLEFLAHHDPLTHLPNRTLVKDRVVQALALAAREKLHVALMFLDLDHFKEVNDTLGHVFGDTLLQAIVSRLNDCVRDTDTISRQGGDEFLIALSGVHNTEAVTAVSEKILQQMDRPFELDGHTLSCSFSIGIATYPEDGADFDTLLLKADTAMYHAKDAGRNTYRFFTEKMNSNAHERFRMQNCLRQAIECGELQLHYQPQVDLASGRIIGAEALLRWHSAELGSISPARFIPIAEDSGLIIKIGEWVLREACRQTEAWRQAGLPPLSIAVNMSPLQFKRSDPVALVNRILAETGLPADCLELEITESLLIDDIDEVLEMLGQLTALGIKIAIDDFGTGYSSLSYLKRFPIDKLKIDQSFVRDIATDLDDAAIVRVIIELGRILKLKVIAEGVEDTQQLAFLTQQGCNHVQGYLFGRPMPADQFARQVIEEALKRAEAAHPGNENAAPASA
jgi:diguanylate cyclase (GGDEF)-like protein/PAS domain S-box-containing protein